jgi:two-component system, NtrC family, sensor kinase
MVGFNAAREFIEHLRQNPMRLDSGSASGRAALSRQAVHLRDVESEAGYEYGEVARRGGARTVLAVPMLRQGVLVGVMTIWKRRVEAFSTRQ